MPPNIPISIEEYAGIDRHDEPVTVGIPFAKGTLGDHGLMTLTDPEAGRMPLQTQTLATWSDGSLKWVLLDFQTSIEACQKKDLALSIGDASRGSEIEKGILIEERDHRFLVDTQAAKFLFNERLFKPFDSVLIDQNETIIAEQSDVILKDKSGIIYKPHIGRINVETQGPVRSTIKVNGKFKTEGRKPLANFSSRIHFFMNSNLVKLEFIIHNPRAAKHPGGLWDLGDPGSVYFRDLSLNIALAAACDQTEAKLSIYEDPVPMDYQDFPQETKQEFQRLHFYLPQHPASYPLTLPPSTKVVLYQDSSGGKNWQSRNHVNRNGEVRNSFRGYRVYEDEKVRGKEGKKVGTWEGWKIIGEGLRANPVVTMRRGNIEASLGIQNFWQNFPKALGFENGVLIARIFPEYYDDEFELQGGEQKTHSVFLSFSGCRANRQSSPTSTVERGNMGEAEFSSVKGIEAKSEGLKETHRQSLDWIQSPVIAHTTPEWYVLTGAIPYLVSEKEDLNREPHDLIQVGVKGDNTFFHRREIIDEYGWRNFGELYANHEEEGNAYPEARVSHYNNQYDCIYGILMQFIKTGRTAWFRLADQLCCHVRDIDIYHTDQDRPEYNHGLFWHTEHYIDAETATHRCFSRKHAAQKDLRSYGGGPSLSHNYTTGLLYHYYLTGSPSSKESVLKLAEFVEDNISMDRAVSKSLIQDVKRLRSYFQGIGGRHPLVNLNKVYGLNGPGRASGNALNTLLDAYQLTGERKYLARAEDLIRVCIHPADDILEMNLMDVENRWMYTVFLQSLYKYLDLKDLAGLFDNMWSYARQSLIHYARWMAEHERLYLDQPGKLEYPGETWAAQDLRKGNILFVAAKYATVVERQGFWDRALWFTQRAMRDLSGFETRFFTRPLAIVMLNASLPGWARHQGLDSFAFTSWVSSKKNPKLPAWGRRRSLARFINAFRRLMAFSFKREYHFLKWRFQ